MGQKTKQQVIMPPPTAEEKRLQEIAGQLGEEQLSAIQSYSPYRDQLFGMIPGLGEALARDLGLQLPAGTFRQITPEERAYQKFLNSKPGYASASAGGDFEVGISKLAKYSPSANLLADTPLEFLGGGGAISIGKLNRKKRKAEAWAAVENERQRRAGQAAWEARGEELRLAAETAKSKQAAAPKVDSSAMWEYGYSPWESDLVNQAADEQLALGSSDIDAAYTESLRNLSQNLAPARGLRGYDAPILDRGGLLAMENVRQKSQLSRGLRAQSANQLVDISGQAKQNRLQLLGFLGNQGLGLGTGDALGAQRTLQQERAGQASTSSSTSGLGLSDVGSIASGVGSLISVFASSRTLKHVGDRLDGRAVLARLRELPLYRWSYRTDEVPHLGPMAEDFQAAFGVGDGRTIAVVDVMGVLLAAMQGLAQEVQHG